MTENTKPTETGGENDSESKDGAQRILDFGAAITRTPHGNVYCLTIIGQIEGHYILPSQNKTTKYEHVIPQIVAVEEDPQIDGLLMLLNTVGGDVEAGLALAELVALSLIHILWSPVKKYSGGWGRLGSGSKVSMRISFTFIRAGRMLLINTLACWPG